MLRNMNREGNFETKQSPRVMQSCAGNRRRVDLASGPNPGPHVPTLEEEAVSIAHFTIDQLARLRATPVDSALAWLASTAGMANVGPPSIQRRALFSCMVERSLPIP